MFYDVVCFIFDSFLSSARFGRPSHFRIRPDSGGRPISEFGRIRVCGRVLPDSGGWAGSAGFGRTGGFGRIRAGGYGLSMFFVSGCVCMCVSCIGSLCPFQLSRS